MNRLKLTARVRSLTRDLTGSMFRQEDILDFLNEGIDRVKQIIPELSDMRDLGSDTDSPLLLPSSHHGLIAVFATARCFAQDERHYQASTYMNEFEQKMEELKSNIESGRVKITDADGNTVDSSNDSFYVEDTYFTKRTSTESFDYPDSEDTNTGTEWDNASGTDSEDGGVW